MIPGSLSALSDGSGLHFALSERLFPVHDAYKVPTAIEAGYALADRVFGDLQSAAYRLGSHLNAFSTEVDHDEFDRYFPRANYERWREIEAICHGASQSANLVLAALNETRGMLDAISIDGPGSHREETWTLLAAGFILESTGQYLVSIGHDLTNAGLRIALEWPRAGERIERAPKRQQRALRAAMVPENEDAEAWLFHSSAHAALTCLQPSERYRRPLRVAANLYGAEDWRALCAWRNQSFHRVRRGFPSRGEPNEAPAIAELHGICSRATHVLSRALPSFLKGIENASPRVSFGKARGVPLLGPETTYGLVGGKYIEREPLPQAFYPNRDGVSRR
jgi:hypothetical protein